MAPAPAAAAPAIISSDILHGDVDDPVARAQHRYAALQQSFANILAILAAMYSDEDWRYLNKPDGGSYRGFSELVATALSCSASYARRYTQGVQSLYLPLQEIVVEGTAIEITSKDVAILGTGGAREVVAAVESRAADVEPTPQSHNELITEVIEDVKAKKRPPADTPGDTPSAPTNHDAPVDLPWDDDDRADDDEDDAHEDHHDGRSLSPSGPDPSPGAAKSRSTDRPTPALSDDTTEYTPRNRAPVVEPLDTAVEGFPAFVTDQQLSSLPSEELRQFRQALNVLEGLNADTIAAAITSDTRGVLKGSSQAAALIADVRAQVKSTADWCPK